MHGHLTFSGLLLLIVLVSCIVNLAALPSIHQQLHIQTINKSAHSLPTKSRFEGSYSRTSLHLYRAGSSVSMNQEPSKKEFSMRRNILKNVLGLWGVMQVVSILANAIKRLIPIAIQPILQQDFQPFHWALYISWSAYMLYTEGYKAFQLKFSPLVVQRAFSLIENPSFFNYVFAGPYSMGLFGASRKRMIISWSITAGVFSLVKLVKMLPYPYRSIVDAGVVAGLSYGAISILVIAGKALLGQKVQAPGEEDTTSQQETSSQTDKKSI